MSYASYIQDGIIINGKDFLKICTRSLGIASDIRDEPLSVPTPTHFEPNPTYEKHYKTAVYIRDKHKQITIEEARRDLIKRHNERVEDAKYCLGKYKADDAKYQKIKSEILKWIPPTSEHENLKKFALEQIDTSMNTDVYKYLEEIINEKLDISNAAVQAYIDELNEYYEEDVARSYKRWQEELEWVAKKNMWMKQFIDSLENI